MSLLGNISDLEASRINHRCGMIQGEEMSSQGEDANLASSQRRVFVRFDPAVLKQAKFRDRMPTLGVIQKYTKPPFRKVDMGKLKRSRERTKEINSQEKYAQIMAYSHRFEAHCDDDHDPFTFFRVLVANDPSSRKFIVDSNPHCI